MDVGIALRLMDKTSMSGRDHLYMRESMVYAGRNISDLMTTFNDTARP